MALIVRSVWAQLARTKYTYLKNAYISFVKIASDSPSQSLSTKGSFKKLNVLSLVRHRDAQP